MAKYTTPLLVKHTVAEGTLGISLKKPEGFSYTAGQFCELTLQNQSRTDDRGNTRPLSLVSAPHEKELMFATRMRDSAFKENLKNLEEGSDVSLEGPFGSFTLHNDASKPAVFLIGGIGITPVRSMLISAAEESLPHTLTLFYSNRRPEDAAFLEELKELPQKNPNFTFVGTMTDMEKSTQEWDGETGLITDNLVKKYISDPLAPIYYLVGPVGMVTAMRKLLGSMGVDSDNIRTEEFSGY